MRSLLFLVSLSALATAIPSPITKGESLLRKRATTLIPEDVFTSTSLLEEYFNYEYPWGDSHNGAALMAESQVTIHDNAYLQIQSDYTGPQASDSSLTYLSGTVWAKQYFTVEADGGLDFKANFVADVAEGCWPAWWLDGVNSWPPEIDMAEWKGELIEVFGSLYPKPVRHYRGLFAMRLSRGPCLQEVLIDHEQVMARSPSTPSILAVRSNLTTTPIHHPQPPGELSSPSCGQRMMARPSVLRFTWMEL